MPPPGNYSKSTVIRASANEPCIFYYQKTEKDSPGVVFPESLVVNNRFEGYIAAVDSAGNRKRSGLLKYSIDTTVFEVTVEPGDGIFNHQQNISFITPPDAAVFYSFDPLAPPEWFIHLIKNLFSCLTGLTILRYYGKNSFGTETAISKAQYVLDTIPPKLHVKVSTGPQVDTLIFYSKEKSVIKYTFDGTDPGKNSDTFTKPLLINHLGIKRVRARARDEAGNVSEIVEWVYKYDRQAPEIKLSPAGGDL